MIRLLARGLHMVHSIDIADCPFNQRLDRQFELVEQRTYAGLVDEDDFDAERRGKRAGDLLEELKRTRPTSEDLVFTHGDFCLPNVIINPQQTEMSGLIDWGRGGIADRYQDIALAARSLAHNFSSQWIPLLLEEYGLTTPDQEKLRFYQLLDEFF
jgi:aminoglycoside phosphotransferase